MGWSQFADECLPAIGVTDFLRETDLLLRRVNDAQASALDITRDLHTLKGNCGVFGIQSVAACCHMLETRLLAEERSSTLAGRAELTASWTEVREGVASLLGEKACSFAVSRDQFLDSSARRSPERRLESRRRSSRTVLTPLDVSFARLRGPGIAWKRVGQRLRERGLPAPRRTVSSKAIFPASGNA